jgi:hypothetical protein
MDPFSVTQPAIRSDVRRKDAAADYLTRSGEHRPFTFMNAAYGPDDHYHRGRLVVPRRWSRTRRRGSSPLPKARRPLFFLRLSPIPAQPRCDQRGPSFRGSRPCGIGDPSDARLPEHDEAQ